MLAATWDVAHPARAATAARAWYEMFALPLTFGAHFAKGALSNVYTRAVMPELAQNADRLVHFLNHASAPYRKPQFDVPGASITSENVAPFFDLYHFTVPGNEDRAKILLFAPMSGHDATILNDTIKGLAQAHDVYVCAPMDASRVPVSAGELTIDSYVATMQSLIRRFQGDVHTMAVSQPGPLLLAAISLMEASRDPYAPKSASFIGSPIDPRINPTLVDRMTTERGTDWFARNAIEAVLPGKPGAGRMVYPGMAQMSAFACFPANANEGRYENTAIADLDGRYFLETIDRVFMKAELPKGEMKITDAHGRTAIVNPGAITRVALMVVEGANDEIVGPGQTRAALDLATNLSPALKAYHREPGAGHYGIIHGPHWRDGILPKLAEFIETQENRQQKRDKKQILAIS